MWKRLQGHGRDRDSTRQIGKPVLVGTTYDEDNLRPLGHATETGPTPGLDEKPLPIPRELEAVSPRNSQEYTHYQNPLAISPAYSQGSPGFSHDGNVVAPDYHQGLDISPPSSPESGGDQQMPGQPRRYQSMRDVSPVDENRGRTIPVRMGGSNIPVLRKAPAAVRNQESATPSKFWGGKVVPNSKVRWDTYSGEPTSSTAGKTGQVSPRSFPEKRPMGYQVSVSSPGDQGKKMPSFVERANRFAGKPAPLNTKAPEPWSKAVGRAEIATPLKDHPSDKLVVPKGRLDAVNGKPLKLDGPVSPARTTPEENETEGLDDSVKPVVPLKVGRRSPPRSLASPTSTQAPVSQTFDAYPSPITPTHAQTSRKMTQKDELSRTQAPDLEPSTPVGNVPTSAQATATSTSESGGEKQPGSRFSWTTLNSSTTYQQTPKPSPPAARASKARAAPAPIQVSSVLDRTRPIAAMDRIPARKSLPLGSPSTLHSPSNTSPRPDSTFSTNTRKALPRPPTEIEALDHISTLESQMEDLKVRRNNVYRLLSDLNNMAPPNPMVTDFKRMRLVDQRKKAFADELAEIKVEEHDVGLKLHRAWRKREKAELNGSESSLWIRRVTG